MDQSFWDGERGEEMEPRNWCSDTARRYCEFSQTQSVPCLPWTLVTLLVTVRSGAVKNIMSSG